MFGLIDRMGVAAELCALIGRSGVVVVERVVLNSEVIMALTSSVQGKEVSFANLS